MSAIEIGSRLLGRDQEPFILAEMSGNHNRSLDRALAIVEAAAESGAHGIKLQTYTADTMTLDLRHGEFMISDPESPWHNKTLHELYCEAHTPWDWHPAIMKRCRDLGMVCFSTPFDFSAVDFLETLNVPAYKVASFEIVDLPLIRKIAATGKPMILSTGMATEEEIEEAVQFAKKNGCRDLVLLQCTSSYPASPENSNLNTIPYLRERFGVEAGLSDHTLGIGAAVAGIALGAVLIEKHFTLSRADGGVDAAFSLEPWELKSLVDECLRAWQSLGSVRLGAQAGEEGSKRFRRSLYIAEDMKAGDTFTGANLRSIRPGCGLLPKHLDDLIGKQVCRDVEKGTPMSWDLIDENPA